MKVKFELKITHEQTGENVREVQFCEALDIPDDYEQIGFDCSSFGEIILTLYVLAYAKNASYGGSWQKRGEIRGVIANLDRKYDRIMNSIDQWEKYGHNDPSPRLDGTADLAVYCLLYLSSFLRQHYPKQFEKWWREEVQGFLDRYRPASEIITMPKVILDRNTQLPSPKLKEAPGDFGDV